jgi:hypothetical protein
MIGVFVGRIWEAAWAVTLGTVTFHLLMAVAAHGRDCEIEQQRIHDRLRHLGIFARGHA